MISKFANEVFPVSIEDELQQSYLDYAMSVIVGRALPDVRDGLKPVHRRVLFAMQELSNDFNKPYKKSARVVGDVIGKYHPHGDTAAYDAIVRMAQPFSLRYTLVEGQGNFGSIDGDSPAAMRYTEVRMSKVAHLLLLDIEKETVNFSSNYDETEKMPDVLPAAIPNLLVNGSSGIAVGMATNMPPHNLSEVINGIIAVINNPKISVEQIMQYIPAPDFPTSAFIVNSAGIKNAYETGKGSFVVRAKADCQICKKTGRNQIIITEIPYQVNKATLVEKIASLVKERKIEGVTDLRDESDKNGLCIVIDTKQGCDQKIILNNLYAHTQMQTSFGINMVALVNNQPRLLTLKQIIQEFIKHRKEVVIRRTTFLLRKARERLHFLEGIAVALSNIDEIVMAIKSSTTLSESKAKLSSRWWPARLVTTMLRNIEDGVYSKDEKKSKYGLMQNDRYYLSPEQIIAILDIKLHRLAGFEKQKILDEFQMLLNRISGLVDILKKPDLLLSVISEELQELKQKFGDQRKSKIIDSKLHVKYEDLINKEDVVVTLSHDGYIKIQPLDSYNIQKRGGKGKSSLQTKAEDFVHELQIASTHDSMLCFSSIGKVYWSKVYDFPRAGRGAKGKPINNFLPLQTGERITAMLAVSNYNDDYYIFMSTKFAIIKKVCLSSFSKPRKGGIYALTLNKRDELLHVALTDGKKEIMMFSNVGKAVRFKENNVRVMGRIARGVRGMKLYNESQHIVDVIVADPDQGVVLVSTQNGYGKRTDAVNYRRTARGSQGVISISTSKRNGLVVSASLVENDSEVMLITDQGILIRIRSSEIRKTARSAQGVNLINLKSDEKLVSVKVIKKKHF